MKPLPDAIDDSDRRTLYKLALTERVQQAMQWEIDAWWPFNGMEMKQIERGECLAWDQRTSHPICIATSEEICAMNKEFWEAQ
jgi:hypothetical protein